MAEVLITNAVAIGTLMVLLWFVSLLIVDASIVDIFWGFGFAVIASVTYITTDDGDARAVLLVALTIIWGLRLAGYLSWRNLGKGEDYRYQAMRRRYGSRFPIISLFTVFALQGVLMLVVSLPVQAGQVPDGTLIWLDFVGIGVWAVGMFFETVGDAQLVRFKADPANDGKVMDRGLWRYTRHPNYFGDFMVWWGLYLIAVAAGEWWTVVGPIVMSVLLIRVSGAALLEKSLKKRRQGYEEYIRRTSSFFPRPPRP